MKGQLLGLLLCTFSYAVLRYAGFGGVSPSHLPGYIMNKSFAMAAAASLFMAALAALRARPEVYRFWSAASCGLVFLHVLMSLALYSKGYFGKLFAEDRLNLNGEGMLLLGVLGAYCFWRLATEVPAPTLQVALNRLACALTAGHLFVMGYGGWLQVDKWHGGLPPITLLSFGLVLAGFLCFLKSGARTPENAELAGDPVARPPAG